MKNYRTTIAGAALAALSFISIYQANGGELTDWKQWLIPAAIAALGYLAKDAGVTGGVKILLASLCLLTLPSCQSTANNTRLGDLADLAITYASKRGVLTAEDAAAIRAAQVIILPPVADVTVLQGTAPKQPVQVQP